MNTGVNMNTFVLMVAVNTHSHKTAFAGTMKECRGHMVFSTSSVHTGMKQV